MRADRLLSIVLLLQHHGRLTANDLAARLEVSERTIYRDLEALGTAGIPVFTERGPGGGCSLLDGYQTRLTGLTPSEIRALFLLEPGPLADLGLDKALDDALLKLSAALPSTSRDEAEYARQRIHLDHTRRDQNEQAQLHLPTLQQALWQDRKLRLIYSEDATVLRECLVEPCGLVSKVDDWYLVALIKGEMQTVPVSCILNAEMMQEIFTRPANFDLACYWSEQRALLEARRSPYTTGNSLVQKKENTIIILSGSAWRGQRRYAKEKKAVYEGDSHLQRKKSVAPQKKVPALSIKKTASGLRKKTGYASIKKNKLSPTKKTAASASQKKQSELLKKNASPLHIKKRGISLSHHLQAA